MAGIGLFLIILIPLAVVGITLYVKYLCKREMRHLVEHDRARMEYDIAEVEAQLHEHLQSSWESSTFADSRYYTEKSDPRNDPG